MSTRHLSHPPVSEVVCGFLFEPTKLTTLDFGVYWEQRREEFPRHEVHPPILESAAIQLGPVVDARAWLIHRDDELLLQLQHDRFYVNWRRRGDHYPRFSDHDDEPGLKHIAIEEFSQYSQFAEMRSAHPLVLRQLVLTKIDTLKKGADFDDIEDLGKLLPVTRVFSDVALKHPRQLQLRMLEGADQDSMQVAVALEPGKVRIETTYNFPFSGNLDSDFFSANDRVNDVFFGLVQAERFE